MLAKTYQSALVSHGYQVALATNSQEAINMADKNTPGLVVMELQLVGHSGIEFLYEFRSYPDWQSIPVLIHSQVPYVELKDGWPILKEELGVSDYRYKPATNLQALIASVDHLSAIHSE